MGSMVAHLRRRALMATALIAFITTPLIFFQNCAPKAFDAKTEAGPKPSSLETFALLDQVIRTEIATPKEWIAEWTGPREGFEYSFASGSVVSFQSLTNVGTIELIDSNSWRLKFTPMAGYRGEKKIFVYARNSKGQESQAEVTLQVGNALNFLTPALAVRGTGCVVCHAEVKSNIVTDFGHGGDGQGHDYFFGKGLPANLKWNEGAIYGDDGALRVRADGLPNLGAWASIKMVRPPSGNLSVFVPRADLPVDVKSASGFDTLRAYLQNRLTNSLFPESQSAVAVEKNRIYIGAPTPARLKTVFNWSTADDAKKYRYIPDLGGAALVGFNVSASGPLNGKYFTNSGEIECEGDLLFDGTLMLVDAKLKSKTGCRIYVTKSVFIYGPISYVTVAGQNFEKRNLQITSSRGVLMGLGGLFNGTTHCETSAQDSGYFDYWNNREQYANGMSAAAKSEFFGAISDSAKFRLSYSWTLPSFFFRNDNRPGQTVASEIYAEMLATVGPQKDASCLSSGRDVSYERLLLNAPLVESRYAGPFRGSLIAEMALMTLGLEKYNSRFIFEFDPVFQNVDILPMLKDSDFLHVD